MPRSIFLFSLGILLASPSSAFASYQMFCELEGEVVSAPVRSDFIEFDFLVTSARDIEIEVLGSGEPDCDLMQGKRVRVLLEDEDTADLDQIAIGASLVLERYEIDVINQESGQLIRSVKHVRKRK